MTQYEIHSFSYNEASIALRKDITELLNMIWPDADAQTQTKTIPSHRFELSARSFCCYSDKLLVGYAAILYKEIVHCGNSFMMAGLSCVATHPDYRGCSVGSTVVSAATEYLTTQSDIDFGIYLSPGFGGILSVSRGLAD